MNLLMSVRSVLEYWSISVKRNSLGYYLIEMFWEDHNTKDCEFSLKDLENFRDNLTMVIDSEKKRIQDEKLQER